MNEVRKKENFEAIRKEVARFIEKVFDDRLENPDFVLGYGGKKLKIWWYDLDKIGWESKPFELNSYEREDLLSILEEKFNLDFEDNETYEMIEELIHQLEKELSPVTREIWLFKDAFCGQVGFFTTSDIEEEEFVEICTKILKEKEL